MDSATWHALPAREALARLESGAHGLSAADAARRLERAGPNRLSAPPPASALSILRDQLTSVVVFLLCGAAVVSLILRDALEAIAIAVVLVINAAIGFVTELRARRAMEALLRFDVPRASVVRDGQLRSMPADQIVPGDVIQLTAGRHVPADARLIDVTDLSVDEAPLTGESLPVAKSADDVLDADTPLADRTNMVYKGTTVSGGVAHAVVTATGMSTELGRIGAVVGGLQEEQTPLERRLDSLGRRLVWLTLAVAVIVGVLDAIQGSPIGLVIETAIALAVAAVPEALPAVATISLAVGLRRMARRHALVRRLPAVEALGSTTVICTDKTRTLTSGEMSLVRVWTAGTGFDLDSSGVSSALDERLRRALEVAAFASQPQAKADDGSAAGDPVDLALLRAASRAGVGRQQLIARQPSEGLLPFSNTRKLMASFHRSDEGITAFAKGAPRQILSVVSRTIDGATGAETPVDDEKRRELLKVNDGLARDGLRVLAIADGRVDAANEAALKNLTFTGFLGLMDPPAAGVQETIERLKRAGLRTIMLTGDQRLTAEAIAKKLGLLRADDRVLDGRELDRLSREEVDRALANTGAFSRVSPEHKLTIVDALQRQGEIVAMLGDGVNDAAALKKADVGVAMGVRGTDVAKEAASIVLQNDRFETIAAAVEEGRVIYDNIRKFVFYLFSCNVAEVMLLLVAGLAGLPLPLLPLQILWLNIVTDTFPALALAMEPGDPDVMARQPRNPQDAILSREFLGNVLFYGVIITGASLAGFLWALRHNEAHATTLTFMILALAQVVHLGNARSLDATARLTGALANGYAIGGALLAIALQIAAIQIAPLASVLRLTPLDPVEWAVVVALSVIPAVVGLARRALRIS